jgi:catabolite regulation protein CreA
MRVQSVPVRRHHVLVPTLDEAEIIGDVGRDFDLAGFVDILVVNGVSAEDTRAVTEHIEAETILNPFRSGERDALSRTASQTCDSGR